MVLVCSIFIENPKSPIASHLKNPKSLGTSPLKNPKSPTVFPLKIPKSPLKNPKSYDDEFFDSYDDDCYSVETDPKWGRELDSEGEPIYTPEVDLWADREYSSIEAYFSNTDCEDED